MSRCLGKIAQEPIGSGKPAAGNGRREAICIVRNKAQCYKGRPFAIALADPFRVCPLVRGDACLEISSPKGCLRENLEIGRTKLITFCEWRKRFENAFPLQPCGCMTRIRDRD